MFARNADWLARETARDAIYPLQVGGFDFAYVAVALHVGPVLFENPCCVIVPLDLPTCYKPCPLEAKVDAADTTEQAAER